MEFEIKMDSIEALRALKRCHVTTLPRRPLVAERGQDYRFGCCHWWVAGPRLARLELDRRAPVGQREHDLQEALESLSRHGFTVRADGANVVTDEVELWFVTAAAPVPASR